MPRKSKIIIPAILAKKYDEVTEKIKAVQLYVTTVQIDVMDNKFVPNKTFAAAYMLASFKTTVDFEIHLMVANIQYHIARWGRLKKVKRIIFAYESQPDNVLENIAAVKKYNKEVGLAIEPETPVSKIKPYVKDIDYVLIMTVHSGFGGQKFLPKPLEKVKQLKKLNPKLQFGVDGGVGLATIGQCKKAGIQFFGANSAIFTQTNIGQAIYDLEKKVQ